MALDFYPWQPGDVIKAEDLNALVQAIQDGTIFLNTTYLSEQLATTSSQLTNLTQRVTYLESLTALASIREQFTLTAGQSVISLSKVPSLDSEIVVMNGLSLSKTGIPTGFVGDYSHP